MPTSAEAKTNRLTAARRRLLTHITDNVDEAFIRRVTIPGFVPSDKKIAYALAYVCADPNADSATILGQCGVSTSSLRRWRARPVFNRWLHAVCMACTGCCVSLVWRIFGELAADGNVQAGKMILQRFDLDWRAILRDVAPPSRGPVPDDASLKAQRAALPTSEDEPIEPVADGSGTAAGDEPQATAPQVSPSQEEGAGGGVGPPL